MSGFNPYADKKEEIKETDESDFTFIKDRDLNMSKPELKGLVKAMESEEFKNIMSEYMNDISDPKNKQEMEDYLKQCEENGELPPNTKLIRPIAGFCLKTTSSKLINRKEKKYFEQKTFINVTSHEIMDPPKKVERSQNGKKGFSFELPYRVSKGRPDQDNKGSICTTYDVVFHPEVISMAMLYKNEFLKFVCDTAVEGVSKVLTQENEKLSKDYKVLNKLRCKGGQPASITIKVQSENPIIDSMDPSKHETKLQKEIMKNNKALADKKMQEKEEFQDNESDEEDEQELKRVDGISEPKYKVVYTYPVDINDCWTPPADVLTDRKFPVSLRVIVQAPYIDSIANADLDINEDTLIFKVEDTYDLMLQFKYKVDPDKGKATFEKDHKRLTIDLPIIGVTDTTHEQMRKEKEMFEKNMKRMSGGDLVQDMDEYTEDVSRGFETDIDLEQHVDLKQIQEDALKSEEPNTGFLNVYDESKNKVNEEEQQNVPNEIKFKEDESDSRDIIGINPFNSKVDLIKEIEIKETPEEDLALSEIKKELGIPIPQKEKEFE